ncbi:hypothetical protein GH5_00644 [Leishmania sp. Ghana 2012 LV757]|uniref:hypothetical protein n=1 Tax=Leishmania sp. Ghana 2012 LV757 TaxID=2803181 RepID=UPI001B6989B3|nr:hypothetical protein GH5_00644 [Leishmania sp. Ghana 2012 LV757]
MCWDKPPRRPNWRLYYLLDLIPPTTARQVKWNFRKVTLRHHYYEAYLVLYNRSRKYLYDSIGENAYGFISSGAWGPFVPVLGAVGSVLLYSLVLLTEMALLIAFFALLAAKDGNYISCSWQTVVLPLMIFVAIMVAVTLLAIAVNLLASRTYQEGMPKMDRVSPIGNFFAAACYFCIPFVICTQALDVPASKAGVYLRYMIMPILGDIFYYATSLIWRWPRRLQMQMEVGGNRPSAVIYNGIFCMGFLNMACGVAQWVLIGLKLDGRVNRSWYVIFIPFCVRAGLRVLEACLRSSMKYTIGVRSEIGVAFDTVGSFFSNGMLLVSLYFVAVRIQRGRERVLLMLALIPVYLTLAWIFVCLIVTTIALLTLYRRRSREERRLNSQWTPPQEKYEEGTQILGGTDTSDSAPAHLLKASQSRWGDVDVASTSLSPFPAEVDNRNANEEYEDFESDEGEPVYAEETGRRPRVPSGSPRGDDGEATYSDATPVSTRGGSRGYEVSRRTNTTTRRIYDAGRGASYSASERSRSGSASRRVSPEGHSPAASSGMRASAISTAEVYTEVTTYMDERSAASSTEEDATLSESYSYTYQTTYFDEENGHTRGSRTDSYTRSSSFSSSVSSGASWAPSASRNAKS